MKDLKLKTFLLLTLILIFLIPKANLQCTPAVVRDFGLVNNASIALQKNPSIINLEDQGWIVGWEDFRTGSTIYGQRFDEFGEHVGSDGIDDGIDDDFPQSDNDDSEALKMGKLLDGGWVVVYASNGTNSIDIFFQRFFANGSIAITETIVNDDTNFDQYNPYVAGLPNGGWVIAWTDSRNGPTNSDVYAQFYHENGSTMGVNYKVNTGVDTQHQRNIKIATHMHDSTPGSTFMMIWEDSRILLTKTYYQLFDAQTMIPVGVNEHLNPTFAMGEFDCQIANLKDAGYVITWTSFNGADQFEIYSVVVDRDGNNVTDGPVLVNQDSSANDQEQAKVTGTSDGGFVIVWKDYRDFYNPKIYAKRYSPDNVIVGEEFMITDADFSAENKPVLSASLVNDANYVMIAWTAEGPGDDQGIFYTIYNVSYVEALVDQGIGNQEANVSDYFSFEVPDDAFECQGDQLSYQAQLINGESFPDWLEFNETTKTFTGTPYGCAIQYTIEVEASCCISTAVLTFVLEVRNDPVQLLNGIPDQEVQIGDNYSFDINDTIFYNNELNEDVTYRSTLADNSDLPPWLTFDPEFRSYSGPVPISCSQTLDIKVMVNDTCESNPVAEDIFELKFMNEPIQLVDPIANQSNSIGVYFEVSFTEGTALTDTFRNDETVEELMYTATLTDGTDLPGWMIFNETLKKIDGYSPNNCTSSYEIKVSAFDECETNDPAVSIFTWEFVNNPPTNTSGIDNLTYEVGDNILYIFNMSTFQNDEIIETVTYSAELFDGGELPTWIEFVQAERKFTGEAPYGCPRSIHIIVRAHDECETNDPAWTDFWVEVTNSEVVLANEIANKSYEIGLTVNFMIPSDTFNNTDANENLQYSAEMENGDPLPDWLAFDNVTLTFSGESPDNCSTEYMIKVIASDSCDSAYGVFLLNITNEPPYSNHLLVNRTYEINTDFEFVFPSNAFGNDEIVETIVYESTLFSGEPLPSWLNFTSTTRTYDGLVPLQCPQILKISLIAKDLCYTASDFFYLEIINAPPEVLNVISNTSYEVGENFTVNDGGNTFYNADANEDLQYSAELENGDPLPDWMNFDNETVVFSGTVPFMCPEEYVIRVTARDSCSGVDTIFSFEVVNTVPAVNVDRTVDTYEINSPFAINIGDSFDQVDLHDELTFSVTQLNGDPIPDWMNYNPATLILDGTTPSGCPESWDMRIRVEDSCYVAHDDFVFEITNMEPTQFKVIPDKKFEAGQTIAFDLDSDTFNNTEANEDLQYSVELENGDPLPMWLEFDNETLTFTGEAPEQCPETLSLRIMVKDSCFTVDDIFLVNITNQAPLVIIPAVDQTYYNEDPISFTLPSGTFTNKESFESLTYSAYLEGGDPLPMWLAFENDTLIFSGQAPDGCAFTENIVVRCSDSCLFNTTTFALIVENDPPVQLANYTNQVFQNNEPIDFYLPEDAFNSTDSDETLSYDSQLSSGQPLPDWLDFDPDTQRYQGTAPDLCGVDLVVEVLVTDGCTTISTTFELLVGNEPPVLANQITDKTFLFDEFLDFTFPNDTFTTDNPNEEITYSINSTLPSWLTFVPEERRFFGTSPECEEVWDITVNASDSCYSIYDTFELFIQNNPPVLNSPIPDLEVHHDTELNYTFPENTFTNDEAKETLVYESTLANGDPLPTWLEFDAATRNYYGTSPRGCNQTLNILVKAEDMCNFATDEFEIVVFNYQIYQDMVLMDHEYEVGESFEIDLMGTFINDDSNEEIEYEVVLVGGSPLPEWMEFVDIPGEGKLLIDGEGPLECSQVVEVMVIASDSCNSINDTFSVTIVNAPLTINGSDPLDDQMYEVGEDFEYIFDEGIWTNADLYESIEYNAYVLNGAARESLPDWLKFYPMERKFNGTTPLQCSELWEIVVVANDSCTESDAQFSFRITNAVVERNHSVPLEPQEYEVGEGFEFFIDEGAFYDTDLYDVLDYASELNNGDPLPEWLDFVPEELKFIGTVDWGCAEDYEVKVIASDSCMSVNDFFIFKKLNSDPVLNGTIPDQEFQVGEPFDFPMDPALFENGDMYEDLSFEAKLNNDPLPDWIDFDSETLSFNGTFPPGCSIDHTVNVLFADTCTGLQADFTLGFTNSDPYVNSSQLLEDHAQNAGDEFEYVFASDTFVNEDMYETLEFEAKQTNGDPLPNWLDFVPEERRFTGTVESCSMLLEIAVLASDSCMTVQDDFTINITNVNIYHNEVIGNKNYDALDSIDFALSSTTFVNEEVDEMVTYAATLTDNSALPDWIDFIPAEQRFVGTAPGGCGETINVVVTAEDTCVKVSSNFFNIVVGNSAPTLNAAQPLQDQSAHVGEAIYFVIPEDTFLNADANEELTYEAVWLDPENGPELPAWIQFNNETREFTGEAPLGCEEALEIQIIASDTCQDVSDTFIFTKMNSPVAMDQGFDDKFVTVTRAFVFSFEDAFMNDDAAETLAYETVTRDGVEYPEWLIFDAVAQTYSGTAPPNCSQTIPLTLMASDTCDSNALSIDWDLNIVNEMPAVNVSIPDEEWGILTEIDFVISEDAFANAESDIEGLSYSASLGGSGGDLPEWLDFDPETRRFTGFRGGCGETLNIAVSVVDSCESNIATQVFALTITNEMPEVVNSIADKTYQSNATFDFTFDEDTFSNSEETETITYEAYQASGMPLPPWMQFDPETRRFYGMTPIRCPMDVDVLVAATDSCASNVVTDSFTFHKTNEPPIANPAEPLVDQFVEASQRFEFTISRDAFINPDSNEEIETDPRTNEGRDLLPDWITYDDDKFKFAGVAPSGCDQVLDILVYAGDTCHYEIANQTFDLYISNTPPTVANLIPDLSLHVNEVFTYEIPDDTFVDSEETYALTYGAELANGDPLPDWLEFDTVLGVLSGVAPEGCEQEEVLSIFAYDSCDSHSVSTPLTIEINSGVPELNEPNDDATVAINTVLDLTLSPYTFTELDDMEQYQYTAELANGDPLPLWMEFEDTALRFTGPVPDGCGRQYDIKVTAQDACETATASDTFALIISNQVPFINLTIEDVIEDTEEDLDFTVNVFCFGNPEASEGLTYRATEEGEEDLPGWLEFDPATRTFSGTTPDDEDEYVIVVYARDSCNLDSHEVSQTFTIVVQTTDTQLLTGLIAALASVTGASFLLFGFIAYRRKKKEEDVFAQQTGPIDDKEFNSSSDKKDDDDDDDEDSGEDELPDVEDGKFEDVNTQDSDADNSSD
ncbi:dystroglycan-related [Anaeramoeba flamelloides]|uniref:Dystroglycan-related n=1 Tax=Anaeramoeba flamelloides TaxID=1746091 RepID=A0ABQ8X4Q9_9EUKA|nr:dystroglycan-related [Anaeramoeba flamelloides]